LENELEFAVNSDDFLVAARLRDEKRALRKQDPKTLHSALEEALEAAAKDERYRDAARLRDQMRILRKHLPQFKLAGLWKGHYGDHGETVIRISYDGDMMYATKVTGDTHVPAGEVTFRVDLSSKKDLSRDDDDDDEVIVEEIEIQDGEITRSTQQEVFKAEGMIATKGYEHAHFVPGRLLLFGQTTIGFFWVPFAQFVQFDKLPEEIDQKDSHEAVDGMREVLERNMKLSH
jgi:hypothetical protein